MAQYLPLPDGSFVIIRQGEVPADAWERAQREYPTAFGIAPQAQPAAGPPPEGGFVPAFKAGVQNLMGQGALAAGKLGLRDAADAQRAFENRQLRAQQLFKPTDESFIDAPLTNIAELAGGSAPFMVAPLVAGAGAAVAGAPAAVGLGAAGLASLATHFGGNLGTQVERGETLDQASGGKAAAAAVPQAVLDVVGLRFIPGVGRLFGAAGEKVTAETAKQMAAQKAQQVAADYLKATGTAMTAEGLTETMQQVLGRAQADLRLMDPEARGEYLESFFGGAVLGGTLAVPGRAVERGQMKQQSNAMAAEQNAAAQAQAAAQEEASRAAAAQQLARESNPREMGPQRQGDVQQMIPGVDAYAPPADETDPEAQVADLRREQEQLRTLVRNSDDLYRMERDALRAGRTGGPSAVQQVQQAQTRLKEIDEALRAQGVVEPSAQSSVAQRLRKAQEELQTMAAGDENAYDPEQVDKIKRRIARLQEEAASVGGAQDAMTADLFGTINVNERTVGRNVTADRQQLEREIGQQRETMAARREQLDTEVAALRRMAEGPGADDPTNAANLRRALQQQRALEREIAEMEAAARTNDGEMLVEQPRLFGEPASARVGEGTGGTARSEAQIRADIEIARAARDREKLSDLADELRSVLSSQRTRNTESAAAQTDVSEVQDRELERSAGMRLPANAARRQAITDARYRAFGQMVSTVSRFNQGRADRDAMATAERQVADNLIEEIQALRGSPLDAGERADVLRELRPLLTDLQRRFGDTRSEVNVGTRKEPQMEAVQSRGGQFRRELPGAGAGPTGMGLENQETRKTGDRTFSNPFAAAQSILGGIDAIRNKWAGTQESAPGVDRTDRVAPTTPQRRVEQLEEALRAARPRATPAQQRLLDQIEENQEALLRAGTGAETPLRTPQRLGDTATEFGNRVARGQDTADIERELQDGLRLVSEAQDTADGNAGQMDMVGGRGTVFSTYAEFADYLGGDALASLKLANGQTRQTLERVLRLGAPLRKRAEELQAQIVERNRKKRELLAMNDAERRAADTWVEDADAAVAEAQARLDLAIGEHQEALTAAQNKLTAALDNDARIAREIAENEAAFSRYTAQNDPERPRVHVRLAEQLRAAQTRVIQASRELATAKEALAAHAATLFSSTDPISRPKLAKYNALQAAVDAAQKKMLDESTRAQREHAQLGGIADTPIMEQLKRVSVFHQQAADLVAQRRQHARVIGGLTTARNRAQRRLDETRAQVAASDVGQQLTGAQRVRALGKGVQQEAGTNAAGRARELARLDEQTASLERQRAALMGTTGAALPPAPRSASPELESTRARRGQADREAADAAQRRRDQEEMATRQQGVGTEVERISFERRRLDQESLNEARDAMTTLEDILARVPMDAEQRARYDEAAAEYAARRDALERKAQVRLANVEGKLNAQRKRIEALRQAQAAYAGADVGSPERDAAQERVATLTEAIRTQGEKTAQAWGVERTRVEKRAARRLPANADEQVAAIAETQTRARTTSPATRETTGGSGFRTGDPDTSEARASSARVRIVERKTPATSRRAVTAAEIAEANAAAQTLERARADAAEANAAAEKARSAPAAEKTATVEKAERVAKARVKTPKQPRSRAQDAVDDGYYDFEPALFREDNTYYEAHRQTPVNNDMEDALEAGDVDGFLAEMERNGSTTFNRSLARFLRTFVQDTRITIEDVLIVDGKRVLGVYRTDTNTVSLDAFGGVNEETVLHELVHAATLRALRGQVPLSASQQAAVAELRELYAQVQQDPLFRREYANKNLEEFVAELMANPQVRDKVNRMAAGQSSMLQRIYTAILNVLGIPRKYTTEAGERAVINVARIFEPSQAHPGAGPAVASVMRGVFPATRADYTGVPEGLQGLTGRVVGRDATLRDRIVGNVTGLAMRTQFLDRYAPIERLLEQGVARGMLSDAQALQTSYFLRFGAQRNQFVSQAATAGVPQLMSVDGGKMIQTPEGDRVNLSKIATVLSSAGVGNEQATEDVFTTYLALERAKQVGFNKLSFDGDVTPKDARDMDVFLAANPPVRKAFEQARAMYRTYNNELLDLMQQTGVITAERAASLKKGDYVPYYRQDASGAVNLIVNGEAAIRIGNIKDQPYLHELVGGNEKILPFFAGAMQNTSLLIDAALRNKQVMEVAAMMQTLGASSIRPGAGPASRNVLRYNIDGKPVHIVVTDAVEAFGVPAEILIKGLEGIKTSLPAVLQLLQIPTNILRAFITRSPAYALRQLIREPINAWMVSGANFTPVVSSVKELAGVLKGTSGGAQALERTGAISSNVFTGDVQDQARILRDVQANKTPWHAVMAAADKMAMASDTATRAVVYDRLRAQGLTHMQATLATLETMNFSRQGLSPTMQMMSMLVPFFNAQVQGIDVIYRAARGRATLNERLDVQRKMLVRGLGIAAATLAYAAMMQDDEAYMNATPEQRALNWFLPLPGFDEPLRVPIPFELGYVFKALPELVFNTAFGDTKAEDAAATIGRLAWQTVPIALPQAIQPGLEVVLNKSLFTDAPIETSRDLGLQQGMRVRDNTTAVAAALGAQGPLSPVQIDYLVRGYTGGLGASLLGMFNAPVRLLTGQEVPEMPTRNTSQMPFVGALFQPVDGRAVIDDAYETAQSWQQAHNTMQALLRQGKTADARRFAQEFAQQVALNTTGGAFRQQMGELANLRRAVVARSDLTPAQKREQVDRIRQLEIALARRVQAIGDQAS